MDAHFVLVPRLGTLTTRGLASGDVQGLGRQTDRALDVKGLGASTLNQLLAHLLKRSNLARAESDADFVDLLQNSVQTDDNQPRNLTWNSGLHKKKTGAAGIC